MVAPTAASHRPRLSLLCLYTIAFSAFFQAFVLFYHHVSNRAPTNTDAVRNSLDQFSSHSASNNKMQEGKDFGNSIGKKKMLDKLAGDESNANDDPPREQIPLQVLDQNNNNNNTTFQQGIPNWLSEYIKWHNEQRQALTPDNWNATGRKYLVMQCLNRDERCGGTADRLKPIPTLLLLAFQYKRILWIHWERPCPLDQFLQPASGGLDWRVPDWLDPSLLGSRPIGTSILQIQRLARANGGKDLIVHSRYQSDNGGAEYYNTHFNKTGESTLFEQSYHSIWHAIFTPVAPLQRIIDETMTNLSLVPGEYAAAHLRAIYGVESRPQPIIRKWATNAVNCASQLRPGGPVFFASDSNFAIQVVKHYAAVHNYKITSLQHLQEPLHLEKSNHSFRQASDYYDTFVDLYLLGNSKCLAYNVGGFGTWGLLMGYNSSCRMQHAPRHFRNYNPCDWANASINI